MEITQRPRTVRREAAHTLGIRVVTPFRGMLRVHDELLEELLGWLDRRRVGRVGRFFLRLNVIDMKGSMDLEVGVTTSVPVEGDGRVRTGVLPAGRYASLRYRGAGTQANRELIEWTRARGVELDRRDVPAGDAFACRYESYVTDPRVEPRKKSRIVELNILAKAKALGALSARPQSIEGTSSRARRGSRRR